MEYGKDKLKENLKNAICNNDIDFLIQNRNDFDINDRFEDEDNDTLLLYALSDHGSETYKFFLDNKADITLVNDEGENAVHSIVYSNDVKRLEAILNQFKLDINHQTHEGITPILLAVLLGDFEMFDSLLRHGADFNISDKDGNMPIHVACQLGYKHIVYKLVESGANLSSKTNKGNYPLALAVNGDHIEIVKYLYDKVYS